MGWGRMFFLGDVGQQLDLRDHRSELEDLRTGISIERAMREGADEMIGRLRRENNEIKLCLAALVRLLLAKNVVTVDEIRKIVEALDGEDQKADGVYDGPVVPGASSVPSAFTRTVS
jgi:hypothetical protein